VSLTDNMNEFQVVEMNSIKSRNQGGTGWVLNEFGHRMRGETAIVRCVRLNAEKNTRRIVEYAVDPKGRSTIIVDDEAALI